jgi:hypothetical protein
MGTGVETERDPKREDDAGSNGGSEGGFWRAAGGDFDDQAAEQHASKITALWELGGEFAALKPASADASDAEAWSAEPAQLPAADDAAIASAPTQVQAIPVAPQEIPVAPAHEVLVPPQEIPAAAPFEPAPPEPAPQPRASMPPEPLPSIMIADELPSVVLAPEPTRASAPPAAQPEMMVEPATSATETVRAQAVLPEFTRPPAPEPRRRTEERVELPRSKSTRLFALAGLGALTLLAIVIGVAVYNNSSDEGEEIARADGTTHSANAPAEAEQAPAAIEPSSIQRGEAEQAALAVRAAPLAPEPAPGETLPQEELTAQPEPVPPPAPPPPQLARLTVNTIPPTARLLLDGQQVANPYSEELPLGSRHALVALAEGHRAATREITLNDAQTLTLTLEERPAVVSTPPAPAPRARTAPPARARVARPAPRARVRPAPVARRTTQPAPRRRRGAGFVTDNPY